jgi:hypothetical protein
LAISVNVSKQSPNGQKLAQSWAKIRPIWSPWCPTTTQQKIGAKVVSQQGDQIWRIFRILCYSWPLKHMYISCYFSPKRYVLIFDKKCVFRHFRRLFHLHIWSRCYDHTFRRFSTNFCEKMAFFSRTNAMIKFLHRN